jgi:uncharacterized alkaline shock family protein YloU
MDAAPEGSGTGATTIAPGVLVTIARLSALGVSGVSRMAPVAGGVNRLFRRGASEGVRIEVADDTVSADLYLVLEHGSNVRDVGHKVQAEVASAIENMVGMPVARVDVHVEDFDEPPAGE